jgi:hypothetical protein
MPSLSSDVIPHQLIDERMQMKHSEVDCAPPRSGSPSIALADGGESRLGPLRLWRDMAHPDPGADSPEVRAPGGTQTPA